MCSVVEVCLFSDDREHKQNKKTVCLFLCELSFFFFFFDILIFLFSKKNMKKRFLFFVVVSIFSIVFLFVAGVCAAVFLVVSCVCVCVCDFSSFFFLPFVLFIYVLVLSSAVQHYSRYFSEKSRVIHKDNSHDYCKTHIHTHTPRARTIR